MADDSNIPSLEELEREARAESTVYRHENEGLRGMVKKLEELRVEDRVALAAISAECCAWKRAFQVITEALAPKVNVDDVDGMKFNTPVRGICPITHDECDEDARLQ